MQKTVQGCSFLHFFCFLLRLPFEGDFESFWDRFLKILATMFDHFSHQRCDQKINDFFYCFFAVFVRFLAPSWALKLTPEPKNLPPEASRGVLERLLWLRVALGFVLGPFWVDLVLDFVTFSRDSGINFAIFRHRFPTSWMYVCIASCTLCVQPRTEKLRYPGPEACAERLNKKMDKQKNK